MKQNILLLTLVLLVGIMVISGCSATPDIESAQTTQAHSFAANLTFESFAELESYSNGGDTQSYSINNNQSSGFTNLPFYYKPQDLPEGAELQRITARDGSYISVEYTVLVDNSSQEYGTIAYATHPGNGSSHFNSVVLENISLYTEKEYDGLSIYYTFDDLRTVPSHCFSFLYEGDFVSYCIPAEIIIDGEIHEITVEEALTYSEVIRVDL